MANQTDILTYQASILMAAVRMTSAASNGGEVDLTEELLAQKVEQIMRRMNTLRDWLLSAIPDDAAPQAFNRLTEIALQQVCHEQMSGGAGQWLTPATISTILGSVGNQPQAAILSKRIPLEVGLIGLNAELHQYFQQFSGQVKFADDDVHGLLNDQVLDIVLAAAQDFSEQVNGTDREIVVTELIQSYGNIYKASMAQIMALQPIAEQEPEYGMDDALDYMDIPGDESEGFDDANLPPNIFSDDGEDDALPFLYGTDEGKGMTADEFFAAVWDTFQIRRQQLLSNVTKLRTIMQKGQQ